MLESGPLGSGENQPVGSGGEERLSPGEGLAPARSGEPL